MDRHTSNWMMEFLRRSSVLDSTIKKTLAALPLSDVDSRLKITFFLRILQTQLVNASLSENSLQILELLETLYRNRGVPISDAMRRAYCAVAAECTVKYLITCPDNPSGEYFSAVRRIWHGRVVQMPAEGRPSELLSDELAHWKKEVEAALWDVRVSERLVGLNTRRDAMNEMKRFLKETLDVTGICSLDLDLMATFSEENDLCRERACEIVSGSSEVSRKRVRRSVESLGKEKMNSDADGENDNVNVNDDRDGDVATMHENNGNGQLKERLGTSNVRNQEVGWCDSSNGLCPEGVCVIVSGGSELSRKRDRRSVESLGKEKMNSDADGENDNVNDDRDGDVATMHENHGNGQLEERLDTSNDRNQEVGWCDSSNGLCPEGVCEIVSGGSELSRKHDRRSVESLGKEKMNSDADRENDNVNDDRDGDYVATMHENHGNGQLKERLDTSNDRNQEVGWCDSSNGLCSEGVCEIVLGGSELLRKRDRRSFESLGKEKVNFDGDGENDNMNDDRDGDVATMHENHGDGQLKERLGSCDGNQEVGWCDSANGDKEIRKDNLQLKRKHYSNRTYRSRVRISGGEETEPTDLSSKCENLPSAEVKRVRESLKLSSMELKTKVNDPLPDSWHRCVVLGSKLPTKDKNCGPRIENQSRHVDVPDVNACKTIVLYQPNDVNIEKKSSVYCSSSHRPNLMENASSAHAFEWNDSIENVAQPKKKKRRLTPLEKDTLRAPQKKKRKWTLLEENTLRDGVKEHGEGNWKTIKDSYPEIFKFRTNVDLKDKWRNMPPLVTQMHVS